MKGTDFVTYGYRCQEVGLDFEPERPDASYRLIGIDTREIPRKIMRVSLGCHLIGAANPVPDTNHAASIAQGAIKRVASAMPPLNRAKVRRLSRFCDRFLKKHFEPFSSDELFDFDEWIQDTNYEAYRKDELREVYNNIMVKDATSANFAEYKKIKMFVKDECYLTYKFLRLICSRSDEYKTLVGPFFKKLGQKIFNSEWFIKKISLNDRPDAIYEKLRHFEKIFCTDFSKYEATFVKYLMKVEYRMYNYFLKNHPKKQIILDLIRKGMHGNNRVENKFLSFIIECKRMSGEMNTSEANGLMNMMITFFLLEESGNMEYDAYFEGDDGIVGLNGNLPTANDYSDLGAIIKIETPERISYASFCGLVFDEDVKDNVCDPIDALMSFGYSTRQYVFANRFTKLSLLRCKSLSLLYQYPGCPILASLARYGLRVTNSVNDSKLEKTYKNTKFNTYEKDLNLTIWREYKDNGIFDREINIKTRILVEHLYKITVDQQFRIEKYLDSLNILQPLNIPELMPLIHQDAKHYYQHYGVTTDLKQSCKLYIPDYNINKYKIWTDATNFVYV